MKEAKGVKLVLLMTVLSGFLYYIWISLDLFSAVKGVSYINVGILAILSFLMFLNNVLILRTFMRKFNVWTSIRECFGISAISAIGNSLAPFGGGTVGKAIYLKKQYDFPYPTFLASMSAASILDLLFAGFLGSSVLIVTGKVSYPWGKALILVFLTLMFLSLAGLSLNLRPCNGGFLKPIKNILDGWRRIRRDRNLIIKISLLLLANHLLSSAELFAGYSAFSIKISIADAILLGAISSISMIVKVTPANIGVYEAVVASSSHLLGLGLGEGLLVAGISRAVSMAIIFSASGLLILVRNNRLISFGGVGMFKGETYGTGKSSDKV